jgi:ankyrin repeat protein
VPQRPFRADAGYFAERADGLLASAQDGTEPAASRFAGVPLTRDGARLVLAREHGCEDWPALLARLEAVGPDDPFVAAFEAIEARDVDALRAVLDRSPDVVRVEGTNGNDLLGFAGTDERLVTLLLERGADTAHRNVHGWTPLHQAAYGGSPRLVRILADAGAPVAVSARGDGGTPLVVALFWGHRETAEALAELDVAPANLRVAAGLGRLELVDDAGAHRGFYRPHSGFPAWRPSDDPQEALDEALAWAARNDRVEALEALVARGADVDADVYRGTALAWAAATGRPAAIRALLALGAEVNGRTTFGGPDHGEATTALHLAAGSGELDAIRALLEAGADPALRDGRWDATPERWAEHGCHVAARELLAGYAA